MIDLPVPANYQDIFVRQSEDWNEFINAYANPTLGAALQTVALLAFELEVFPSWQVQTPLFAKLTSAPLNGIIVNQQSIGIFVPFATVQNWPSVSAVYILRVVASGFAAEVQRGNFVIAPSKI